MTTKKEHTHEKHSYTSCQRKQKHGTSPKHPRSSYRARSQKFIAIASHSGGGGMRGNDAVRSMFSYVGANVLSREILTNYGKEYKKDTAVGIVRELLAYGG